MLRALVVAACVSLTVLFLPADLHGCVLEISIDCPNGNCSSRTTNIGTTSCSGDIYSGFFALAAPADVRIVASGDLPECFSSADIPPEYVVQQFAFCYGPGTLRPGDVLTTHALVSGAQNRIGLEAFTMVVDPVTGEMIGMAWTADQQLAPTCTPSPAVPGLIPSGISYSVTWDAVSEAGATYEVQESLTPDFASITDSRMTSSLSAQFQHQASANTAYYYRVRAVSCGGAAGVFSQPVSAIVTAQQSQDSSRFDLVAPFGTSQPIAQQVRIPNPGGGVNRFAVLADQAWLSVNPSSGTLGSSGTTVTVTIDPDTLPVGATTGTLTITYSTSSGKRALNSAPSSIPVSISLVTPVTSQGKTPPPPNALVIPAVAHVSGGAVFQSDVRLTNPSPGAVEYELFFTPSNSNGLSIGKKTVIRVESGQTVALNDVVKNFFGYTAPTDSIGGSMEIRPLRTSASLTRATSRTYSTSALGTLGQFIPAVVIGDFIGTPITLPGEPPPEGPAPAISLQQVAENSRFRTNLGLVEGAGEEVAGRIRVLSASGQVLSDEPFTLQPAEHRQMNRYLQGKGLTVDDARIEVQVESATGRVTSYASVIDNDTHDPFLVAPTRPSEIGATRYVLPGVAALNNPGSNFFSDVRIYNGGSAAATATLRYVALPGLPGGGTTRQVTIAPGQIAAYDDILVSLFGLAGTGGAVLIDTPVETSLVVTGRTYSRAEKGTYGQFIPAITSEEGTALGEPPLQVLQLEQSPEFRSNLGLVELTGKPVTVRISTSLPDSRVAPFVDVELQPNEMRQYNSFLSNSLNLGTAYNTRVTIQVIAGEGRVAAYGSVVDFRTSDPTYVPAR